MLPGKSAARTAFSRLSGRVRRLGLAGQIVGTVVAALLAVVAVITLAGPNGSAGTQPKTLPTAPNFTLPQLGRQQRIVSLAGYAGRPVIVNFFASWCEPCQKETPLLASFYRTEKGKVALVGLDENDAVGNATTFTQKERVGYPVGFDPAGTAATAYGVNALPQTFFLNARHQVVDRVFGAVTLADLHKGIALATAKS
jgi:cytochrome c biogenesis protein CcmG/thiol:disulfide interchange protein DsbE